SVWSTFLRTCALVGNGSRSGPVRSLRRGIGRRLRLVGGHGRRLFGRWKRWRGLPARYNPGFARLSGKGRRGARLRRGLTTPSRIVRGQRGGIGIFLALRGRRNPRLTLGCGNG